MVPRVVILWSTRDAAELELLLFRGGERVGVEFKCADAPRMTHSNHVVLRDLKLDRLYIVYPGRQRYRLAEKVEVVPLTALLR
jgi:hypothetical protein